MGACVYVGEVTMGNITCICQICIIPTLHFWFSITSQGAVPIDSEVQADAPEGNRTAVPQFIMVRRLK